MMPKTGSKVCCRSLRSRQPEDAPVLSSDCSFASRSGRFSQSHLSAHELRLFRRCGQGIRHHPSGHATSVEQLSRVDRLRRNYHQQRRRLRLLPERAQRSFPTRAFQRGSDGPARALFLSPRPVKRRFLEFVVAAGRQAAAQIQEHLPARHGLFHHHVALFRHRDGVDLLRAAGPALRILAVEGDQQVDTRAKTVGVHLL